MKFARIFEPFIAFLVLNSTLCTNIIHKAIQSDKKLSNYVCKITKDITKSKTYTQDILIGNLGGKLWSSTVNGIAECIGDGQAVIVNDFEKVVTEKTLRKAAVVILTFNWVNETIINAFIQSRFMSTNTIWHFMAKLIIVVPNRHSHDELQRAIDMFFVLGFQNVAIVHESPDEDIQVVYYETLMSHEVSVLSQPSTSVIFADKLKDMNGFAYKVVVRRQIPRILIRNGTAQTPLTYLLAAVNKAQNSTTEFKIVNTDQDITKHFLHRDMHLTLNSGVNIRHSQPQLLTYEENGYCVLVPVPPKTPLFQSILIEPYDGLTWLFLVLTVACCVVVFWMFQGYGAVDSPWLLAYGMFVMFIGQGVEFSRKNRLVLVILLQLIIVMIWILNQAYEGVITSFMIQPIHEHRLKTFDDLIASDHKIMSDGVFASRISGTEAYKILKPRLNTSAASISKQFHFELSKKNYVFILTCDQAEILIHGFLAHVSKKVSYFYYLLPQKIVPFLIQLHASYSNPLIERLQYYMDLCFEAGLMHMWKVFANSPYKIRQNDHDERMFLELRDLVQVFSILIIGFMTSSVIFLVERFCQGILKKLVLAILARKLRNRVHQMAYKRQKQLKHPKYQKGALYYIIYRRKKVKRLQPKKLKVRRIYLQPRFAVD